MEVCGRVDATRLVAATRAIAFWSLVETISRKCIFLGASK